MSVSVLMATYNGEKYVEEQLDSIICQLSEDDELVISDDGSTDRTIEIIKNYVKRDKRIKIFTNNRFGIIKNFEFLIGKASNDIIFLSDQDDIWMENKVNRIKQTFINSDKKLILHNGIHFVGELKDKNYRKIINKKRNGTFYNLISSSYWGCCISLKKELVNEILPFPKDIVAHDQWLGIVAEYYKEAFFLDEDLIFHRIHNANKTKRLSTKGKIVFRIKMIKGFLEYKFKR